MKFYLSHPIRGSKGDKATAVDMKQNNDQAIEIAKFIRNAITPEIDIHVPAEMEEFVLTAYYLGILSEKQILAVDCKIIEGCDAILLYSPDGNIAGGCKIEYDHAIDIGIPVYVFKDENEAVFWVSEFILRS